MKLDLHVHAILAKHVPFEINNLLRMIYNAKKQGLNGFALVDHIHYPGYWKVSSLIQAEFPYHKGLWQVSDDFYMISGAEVNIHGDGHVLLLGDLEELQIIDEELNLSQGYRPSLDEIMRIISSEIIIIGAHPFRPFCGLVQYKPSQIKSLDALEINGSDYENSGRVRVLTEIMGIPVVGGSDAHYWPMVGAGHTVFPEIVTDLAGIKMAIERRLTQAALEPDAPLKVDLCNRFKKNIVSIFDISYNTGFDKELVLSK